MRSFSALGIFVLPLHLASISLLRCLAMAGKTHHGLSNFGLSRPHNNPALFFLKLVSENEGTVVLRLKTQQQTLSPAAKTLQLDLHETTIDYILPNEKKTCGT